jgi:hypothetical protein
MKAFTRELTRGGVQKQYEIASELYADDIPHHIKRHLKILQLFSKSILDRKPRTELLKLRELLKRTHCDMCEISHEMQDDKGVYIWGEMFKNMQAYDAVIDSWCAPHT